MKDKIRKHPWVTEGARELLDSIDMTRVLEFGAGGSSIWFSHRCDTYTIEHDKTWIERVRPYCHHSWVPVLRERPYAACSMDFADNWFGVLMVDGRDRLRCVQFAARKLGRGGILVLDNSERERYKPIFMELRDWPHVSYTQPGPDDYGFHYPGWTTTVWTKP